MSNIHITGYWEGYVEEDCDPFPLNEVAPTVNLIPIAFIQPVRESESAELATQWAFDDPFIYSKEQINIKGDDERKCS